MIRENRNGTEQSLSPQLRRLSRITFRGLTRRLWKTTSSDFPHDRRVQSIGTEYSFLLLWDLDQLPPSRTAMGAGLAKDPLKSICEMKWQD